tara:strand:+ start:185 stop:931 length:747 start_codon:yes stop_codon:yes gene_type:complete
MEYVSRDEWGALDSGKALSAFRRAPVGVIVHHTTGASHTPWERVRQHDRYHVVTRGWNSIAYNWLVSGETGEVFEGRGWSRGAATKGHNHNTVSVSYIGSGDDLTDRGKEAILIVIGQMREKYGDHLWVKCHRDFGTTYCPGDDLATWIKSGMPMKDLPTSHADWQMRLEEMESVGLDFRREPLSKGARGKNVATLQARLNQRINAQLVVDGIFGKATRSAVKEFQSMYPIKVDGVVGPVTWRFLWTV